MGYKKILAITAPLLFLLAGIIYFQRFFTTLGTLIFSYSFSTALSLSFLYFLREEIFCSWLRFTKWYLSFAAIAIILSLGSHGGWGVGNIFDTELVTMFSAGIFFIISLILIVYKSFRLRGGR